jgi:hypothetical protein
MATERGGRIISDQESETVRRILKLFSELTTYRNVYAGQWEEAAILVLPTSRKPAPDPEMPARAFHSPFGAPRVNSETARGIRPSAPARHTTDGRKPAAGPG